MTQRPGFHTSEFIVTLCTIVGSALTAIEGAIPPRWALYASLGATIAYTISRGLAKTETRTTVAPPP